MKHAEKQHTDNKLRIALLVDSNIDSKYVFELAEWGQNQNDLEITHLVIQNIPSNESKTHKAFFILKKKGFFYLMQAVGFALIEKVESLGLKNINTYKNHIDMYDLSD
jgi:hypothetical protein